MGRKSREKKEKRKKKQTAPAANEVEGAGDLRLVAAHVNEYRKGVEEAETALRMLGRDAALTVIRLGEELADAKVIELGQSLVAVRPRFPTNLYELREDSVAKHIEAARKDAPLLTDDVKVPDQSLAVGIFDPARVADALIKSGKPRQRAERLGAGDIAWFPINHAASAAVRLKVGEAPKSATSSAMRVCVESGIVFVGPPQASDGPRLGTIRLDPFTTNLDKHLSAGVFVRVAPGQYEVRAGRNGDDVDVWISKSDSLPDDPIDPGSISLGNV